MSLPSFIASEIFLTHTYCTTGLELESVDNNVVNLDYYSVYPCMDFFFALVPGVSNLLAMDGFPRVCVSNVFGAGTSASP